MNLRSARGFTLIEILLVCALAGILLTAAFPMYSITVDNTRLKKATSQLVADLRQAQILAQREGYRTRVTFDRVAGTYQVELAKHASATANCEASSDYQSVRTGRLQDYQVRLSGTGMDCVVYEPTGRLFGGISVVERTPHTDAAEQGTPSWGRYTDGLYAPVGASLSDPTEKNLISWNYFTEVIVTVDLGRREFLRSVCAQMIENQNDGVLFPLAVRLDYSEVDSTIPPGRNDPSWKTDPDFVVSGPYPVKEPFDQNKSTDGSWRRSCPEFSPNLTARHIRFVFTVDPALLTMMIDEILVDIPLSVTLENDNGRGSKTVTITPVTGRVTIE